MQNDIECLDEILVLCDAMKW